MRDYGTLGKPSRAGRVQNQCIGIAIELAGGELLIDVNHIVIVIWIEIGFGWNATMIHTDDFATQRFGDRFQFGFIFGRCDYNLCIRISNVVF